MSGSMNSNEVDINEGLHHYKRCPYCYTHLKLSAEYCIECRKKVGKVDKLGLARKPFNYKAYIAAALWIIVLLVYFWKLLFVKIMETING